MRTVSSRKVRRLHLAGLLAIPFVAASFARADVISFQLVSSSLDAASGGDVTFQGTVTNQSGSALNASDFFFNFSAYDPLSVNPIQDLGLTDFIIPDGTTSATVGLFDVSVGAVPLGSIFPIDVQLEDALGDLSSTQTVFVHIPDNSSVPGVPEPGERWVLLGALLGLIAWRMLRAHRDRKAVAGFLALAISCALAPRADAQSGPFFSTQSPASGLMSNKFLVLLPIVNSGGGSADAVTITSVTLGTAAPLSPAMPASAGTLNAGDHKVFDLQFDAGRLTVGSNYLLTARGTYQSGGKTLGFAVNRFVRVSVPTADTSTVLQRWITLDAIQDFCNLLPGTDPASDQAAILGFLNGRPEIVSTGSFGNSVWGRFANGEIAVIGNDGRISSSSTSLSAMAASAPAAFLAAAQRAEAPSGGARSLVRFAPRDSGPPPSDLPTSSNVRLMTSLTGLGTVDLTTVINVTGFLSQAHYTPVGGTTPTVEALKQVGGDGVFYFTTHGDFSGGANESDPNVYYSLWTATPADFQNDVANSSDIFLTSPPPLVHVLETSGADPGTRKLVQEWRYGITPAFVRKYWQPFSPGSFIYIDACQSDNADDLKAAIFEKNGSVYAGWTANADDRYASNTAMLVFDRLLGANQVFPESGPPQRPFDWTEAKGDIPLHLGAGPAGEELNFTTGTSNPEFGILAPSIMYMFPNESQHQLTMQGSFGSDPGSGGKVTIGNTAVTVIDWSNPMQIVVDMTDPSLVGDVTVEVRGHKSNVARLTQWEGDLNWALNSDGTLAQSLKMHSAFRADFRQFRTQIHVAPSDPVDPIYGQMVPPSFSTYACTGTNTFNPDPSTEQTITWAGNGSIPAISQLGFASPSGNYFSIQGGVLSHTSIQLSVSVHQATDPCNQHNHIVESTPSGTSTSDFDSTLELCYSTVFVAMTLDESAVIQSDSAPAFSDCGTATFNWTSMTPAANTAPDPNSAR